PKSGARNGRIQNPKSPDEVVEAVRAHGRLVPRGGGSKPALSAPPPGAHTLDLSALAGMLEYEPAEYTFTALTGTPVSVVELLLAEQGQYLPFDPILVERGATLGGTVAAGASGPGRLRYGGVRDFILGVRFVDGTGTLARGGGRVVKNAAGFDLPKLMTGSLGQLGVLIELTFKVFPKPEAFATLQVDFPSLADAVGALVKVAASTLELETADLAPPGRLSLRVGGRASVLPQRIARLREFIGEGKQLAAPDEQEQWRQAREMTWVPVGWALVKIPLTPRKIMLLEALFDRYECRRRYSVGGNVLWLAWPHPTQELDALLKAQNLAALVLSGATVSPLIGQPLDNTFARRVKAALDPAGRFVTR
ncbi:MAG: FAD-binding protein, partial [Ardenticatenaceae bacterium]